MQTQVKYNFIKYCKEKLHDAMSLTVKPALIWGLGWSGAISQEVAFKLGDEGLSWQQKKRQGWVGNSID